MEHLEVEKPPKLTLDVQFGDWVYRHHNVDLLTIRPERTKTYAAALTDDTRTVMVQPAVQECCGVDLHLYGDQVYTGAGTSEPVVFVHSQRTSPPCDHWTYWRPPSTQL
ncbi:MAG: hypothetical protein WBD41_13515 [Rhodococcus sp. (in: high G+C Gram-positive bacteria)]